MSRKNKKRTTTEKMRYPVRIRTALGMMILILAASLFGWYQMNRYEAGILDVCADQQDAYVQLVLDQINLKANREEEEIITDILGTLDASANEYWTLSKGQDMLYVKDVLETNKYKNLTTSSYYMADSARQFLEELQLNRVTHSVIDIQQKNYIASGVIFSYGESEYRLCLLTNRDALLNNNVFLEAKTEIITLFVILLVLMMLISMGFAQRVWGLQMRRDANEELITSLNHSVNRLNDHLEKTDLFDIKHQLWEKRALKTFVKKLRGRQVSPLVLAEVEFETEDVRPMFLIRASMLLDQSVLRFGEKKGSILLLFLKCNVDDARFAIHPLLNSVVRLKRLLVLSDGDEAIKSILTERELE